MEKPDTIVAVATPPGRGAIGIIRVSGPKLEGLFQPLLGRKPAPRHAVLGDFLDGSGQVIDQGLALYFPGPNSYTGEDVLELHGHGGIAVQQLLLRRCLDLGARLAEPGEFTRRAYLNGKLDLAQAESVADLIDAASHTAARSAVRSLKGEFSVEIQGLVEDLINLRAMVEAAIDFPEEDIDLLEESSASPRLGELRRRLDRIAHAARSGSVLREGAVVVLAGAPNVGKSSLLNCLAGEEAAIVTPVPGTTRDAISKQVILEGVPVWITDTAGLRESDDPVEKIGITRAHEEIRRADLILMVADVTRLPGSEKSGVPDSISAEVPTLFVENKIDLLQWAPGVRTEGNVTTFRVSARTGAGLAELRHEILRAIGYAPVEEGVFLARERHLRSLRLATQHLERADAQRDEVELLAEELRAAQQVLSQITGEFTADDLIGEIFARFCIGK